MVVIFKRLFQSSTKLSALKTKLYDFHLQNGGKMVEFAGYSMPIQYSSQGVLASHIHTREKASLFDVSHMLQTSWTGKDTTKFLETLVVADLQSLPVSSSTLSLFTNKNGGIIDDTVINKRSSDQFYVVSNAGCAEKDLKHINEQLQIFKQQGGDCNVNVLKLSLVALQGPSSQIILEKLTGQDLSKFEFMTARDLNVGGINCYVTRCGYTGEDGFELSVQDDKVVELCEKLLKHPDCELAGLGARDSLRLEAGLCLYGHDLNEDITPVEATLLWTIGKRRREEGGFLGAEHILKQIPGKVAQKRIGFVVQGAPARENALIYHDGVEVGRVTSGCPSPCLKKNVGMGYIKKEFSKVGAEVEIKVRNKMQKAIISKMPFVEAKYHRL